MNDKKTDVRIYTYAPHAEWKTALAGLEMEGDSYVVPYKMSLQDRPANSNGTQRLFKVLVTVDLPLSVEARELAVLPSGDGSYFPTCGEIYYAAEFLRLMRDNPEITIQTLTQGIQISRRVSKKDVSEQIAKLSPDIIMPQTLTNIRHHCLNMRTGEEKAGKLRRSFWLHAPVRGQHHSTNNPKDHVRVGVQHPDRGFWIHGRGPRKIAIGADLRPKNESGRHAHGVRGADQRDG